MKTSHTTQMRALLWKNAVIRSRTPKTTLCEILSPVLMMAVLVFAFQLSEVLTKRSKQYTTLSVDLPGPFEDVLRLFGPDIPSLDDIISPPALECKKPIKLYCEGGEFTAEELALLPPAGAIPESTRVCLLDPLLDLPDACTTSLDYWSPPPPENDAATDDDEWANDDETKGAGGTAGAIFSLRRSLNRYLRSPLPTPTFDQYIATGLALSQTFGDATYNQLLNNNDYGREWGNLFTLGTLHITPAGPFASDLVSYLSDNTATFANITHRVHESTADAINYINEHLDERAFALVDLKATLLDPAHVDFTIRMNYTTLPNTNRVTNFVALGLNRRYQRYFTSGFLTMQRTLAEFLFATAGCDGLLPPSSDVYSMPMPTPDYSQNVFYTAVGYLLGLAISMGFLYPMSRLVKSVVEEKESRMKETMLILGVHPTVLWLSWVLTAYITFTLIAVLVTLVIHASFLPSSSTGLLFLYIWLFTASVIGFSFFVASFFSKAKLAAIVAPIALFASLMPRWIFYGTNRYEASNSKIYASLLPCTAFAFGADILSDYEYAEIGVQSFNIDQGAYSFRSCLNMLAFDALFYFFLAWYCNEVIPAEFGVAKHPLFLFFPSYWRTLISSSATAAEYSTLDDPPPPNPSSLSLPPASSPSIPFEPVDASFVAQVQINSLTKQYASAPSPAVDDLSLNMYEDQIMCLLGHNGAGKTTTISVLTGLYPASSGDCNIYGNSISNALSSVRHSMGICPQHNILFPELTVSEHIIFFNAIKGVFPPPPAVETAAQEVGLGDKLSALSNTLSGGMKRKLSVCISLCGNPKFLLLDEPTSGMDPYSRRATWELLRKSKKGRVTLLTTHFMDEADILADRIAVMKTGRLQCVGSSLFLKKRFGVGYNLTCVVDDNSQSVQQGILNFLNHHIPNTETISVSGKEVSFRLPSGSESNFPALFSEFEEGGMRDRFKIGGYGISNTTLEEVFIALAKEETNPNSPASNSSDSNFLALRPPSEIESDDGSEISLSNVNLSPPPSPRQSLVKTAFRSLFPSSSSVVVDEEATVSEIEMSAREELGHFSTSSSSTATSSPALHPATFSQQFTILLRKRWDVQKRDIKSGFFQLVLPALIVGLVLIILTIDVPLAGPSLELSADLYTWTNSKSFKKQAFTEILSGGGSHGGTDAAKRSHERMEVELEPYSNGRIDFEFDPDLTTSTKVSKKLLEEYNDHSHHLRFGSYVFNDSVPLSLTIDWPSIRYDIDNNIWGGDADSSDLPYDGDLNFLLENVLGKPDSDGYYEYSFNTDELKYLLEDVLDYDTNLRYNVSDLTMQAEDAVHQILNITNNTDVVTQLEEVLLDQAIEEFFRSVSSNNETITIDELLDDVAEQAGGENTVDDIPGWFTVKAKKIEVAAVSRKITLTDAVVIVGGGEGGTGEGATTTKFNELVITVPEDWKERLSESLPLDVFRDTYNITNAYSILHNASSSHALPSFSQTLFQNLYSQCGDVPDDARFSISNHPLPLTVTQSLEIRTVLSLFASLFILIPYCYIPAAFVVFVVRERMCKSKHLQLVSGVRISVYWVSTYVFDCLLFCVLTFMIMIIFLWYGTTSAEVFVGSAETFLATLIITLLYGFSSLPFAYILSRKFNNHTTAQISVMGMFFITGFVFVNSYFIMRALESTQATAAVLVHFFRFFPAYNVGEALINLASSFFMRTILGKDVSPFDYHVCGMNMLNMFALSIGYFILLLLLEEAEFGGGGGIVGEKLWQLGAWLEKHKLKLYGVHEVNGRLIADDGLDDTSGGEIVDDDDVVEERKLVNENTESMRHESAVMIKGLWKVYPPSLGMASGIMKVLRKSLCGQSSDASKGVKRAVRGVTTNVPKGEIYGLLGVNGAGKTTALGILTGETTATAGETWVAGFNVSSGSGLKEARKRIGFCPQEDPILELMTGRETLRMFANLRGIAKGDIEATVRRLLTAVGLAPHADKVAGAYSGGNKRKLSLGVALIGDPSVLFIDEASSGMDPVARRKMWDLLSQLAKNRSVILTTHSMEEAEALCCRIMIMVSGRMRCLGSPQHLKTKFVDGFNVDVTCDYDCGDEDIVKVREYLLGGVLPGVKIMEKHGRFLKFSWSRRGGGGLGTAFGLLQGMKVGGDFRIADYSISQYSLESVFIGLAKEGDGAVCAGGGDVMGVGGGGGGANEQGELVDL